MKKTVLLGLALSLNLLAYDPYETVSGYDNQNTMSPAQCNRGYNMVARLAQTNSCESAAQAARIVQQMENGDCEVLDSGSFYQIEQRLMNILQSCGIAF